MSFDDAMFSASAREKDQCIPVFRWEARQNRRRSAEEGRPVFDQLPWVQILIPGDNKNIVERKVTEADQKRWPDQWARFLANSEAPPEGTPLDQWPALSVSQIAELKALNVLTLEALAELSDFGLQKLGPGARDLQRRAIAFLRTAKDDSFVYEQMEELDHLKARVDALEKENVVLRANQRKKPGRPRKVKPDELVEPMPERGD